MIDHRPGMTCPKDCTEGEQLELMIKKYKELEKTVLEELQPTADMLGGKIHVDKWNKTYFNGFEFDNTFFEKNEDKEHVIVVLFTWDWAWRGGWFISDIIFSDNEYNFN